MTTLGKMTLIQATPWQTAFFLIAILFVVALVLSPFFPRIRRWWHHRRNPN